VRFVLANPSDLSRLNEFTDWYDTYSAAITVPGYLANDVHLENPDASGERNSPRYATTYDIVAPVPPANRQRIVKRPDRLLAIRPLTCTFW
jgi:hypothetical protein